MTLQEKFKKLKDPFPEQDIEWRPGKTKIDKAGKPKAEVLAYVTARAVYDRLDDVFGPENWTATYVRDADGVMCKLTILCDNRPVIKMDGSEHTQFEKYKGGISSALKRAASVWGVGRYLYSLPKMYAQFVPKFEPGCEWMQIDGQFFAWKPPKMPTQFLPAQPKEVIDPQRLK